MRGQQATGGEALLPNNFPERLLGLKERADLTWEAMALALGVNTRQLLRLRRGASPSGGPCSRWCVLPRRCRAVWPS